MKMYEDMMKMKKRRGEDEDEYKKLVVGGLY